MYREGSPPPEGPEALSLVAKNQMTVAVLRKIKFKGKLRLIATSWLHRRLAVAQSEYIGADLKNHLPVLRSSDDLPSRSRENPRWHTVPHFQPKRECLLVDSRSARLYFRLPATNPSTALRAVSSRRASTRSASSFRIDSAIPRRRTDSGTAVAVLS